MKCNKRSTFYTLSPSDPMMENHFSFYRSLLFLNSRECMVYYVVQIEQRKYFSLFVPPTHTHTRKNKRMTRAISYASQRTIKFIESVVS